MPSGADSFLGQLRVELESAARRQIDDPHPKRTGPRSALLLGAVAVVALALLLVLNVGPWQGDAAQADSLRITMIEGAVRVELVALNAEPAQVAAELARELAPRDLARAVGQIALQK